MEYINLLYVFNIFTITQLSAKPPEQSDRYHSSSQIHYKVLI
jgi:hypothetical protein